MLRCSEQRAASDCNASAAHYVTTSMTLATVSAANLLKDRKRYSTGSPDIDSLLQGGLARGSILQLSGPPGSGKEQLLSNLIISAVRSGDEVLTYGYATPMSSILLLLTITEQSYMGAPLHFGQILLAKHIQLSDVCIYAL